MYKNTYKIIWCCVIIILFSNVLFAQETKPENRRKIIKEIKAEKNDYYQNTVFNIPLNELKALTKKYFEDNNKIKLRLETYNQLFYTTYEIVMGYTEYEYDANGVSYDIKYSQSKVLVAIIVCFYQNEEEKYRVEVLKRYSTINNPKANCNRKF